MRRLKLLIASGLLAAIGLMGAFALSPATTYAIQSGMCPDGVTEIPAEGATQCPNFSSEACASDKEFLGFPKWYKYLDSQSYRDEVNDRMTCTPKINGIADIWKIGAAVIEIMTRLASLIAIGFVVYGGITYTLSQGNPDKTKQALKTIINAVVGLAITIAAAALVSFIAGRF